MVLFRASVLLFSLPLLQLLSISRSQLASADGLFIRGTSQSESRQGKRLLLKSRERQNEWNGERRSLVQSAPPPPLLTDAEILSVLGMSSPDPPMVLLGGERTGRIDPLDSFKRYTGGWDIESAHYWGSLIWASIYGPVIGAMWIIVGASFLFFLLGFFLCCNPRWKELREESYFFSAHLRIPLAFMIVGLVISCIGLGLVVEGEVQLQKELKLVVKTSTDRFDTVVDSLMNVSSLLREISSISTDPIPFPDELRTNLNFSADSVMSGANVRRKAIHNSRTKISKGLKILNIVMYAGSSTVVALLFIGVGCALLQWTIVTNFIMTLVWILLVITWALFTVSLAFFVLFGDTSTAMRQLLHTTERNASDTNNKLSKMLQCTDTWQQASTRKLVSFVGYKLINGVDSGFSQSLPVVYQKLKMQRICNPFGNPPDFITLNISSCPTTAPPLSEFVKDLAGFKCATEEVMKCISLEQVPASVINVVTTIDIYSQRLYSALPALAGMASCDYVSFSARFLLSRGPALKSASTELWVGFLFISIGAMVFCLSVPIFIFRVSRVVETDTMSTQDPHEPREWKSGNAPPGGFHEIPDSSGFSPPTAPPFRHNRDESNEDGSSLTQSVDYQEPQFSQMSPPPDKGH